MKLHIVPVQFNEHSQNIKMPIGITYYELHETDGVNSFSVAELIDKQEQAEEIVRAVNAFDFIKSRLLAANAALHQTKTFQADIDLAKTYLEEAISKL